MNDPIEYDDIFFLDTRNFVRVTARDQLSSSRPQFRINFNFSCQIVYCHLIQCPGSAKKEYVGSSEGPLLRRHVGVDLDQFLSYDNAYDALLEGLTDFPVASDVHLERLICFALNGARQAVGLMPAEHNVLHLSFQSFVERSRVFYVDDDEEEEEDSSMEQDRVDDNDEDEDEDSSMEQDDGVWIVPIADSFTEALEEKILLGSDENCCVCLEAFDLNGRCEGVCMPCAHAFHEDCIKIWLRRSHCCPICVFEMPIAS